MSTLRSESSRPDPRSTQTLLGAHGEGGTAQNTPAPSETPLGPISQDRHSREACAPAASRLHPKNALHKARLLAAPYSLCVERARLFTESHRATEGLHPSLRAALALRNIFEKMTIRIDPDELLVGNRSSKLIAPPLAPERGDLTFVLEHLLPELKTFGYEIAPEDERILVQEIIPYWKSRSVRSAKIAAFRENHLSSVLLLSPQALQEKLRAFGPEPLRRLLFEPSEGGTRAARMRRRVEALARLPRLLRAFRAGAGDNVKGRGRSVDTQAHFVLGLKNVLRLGFRGIQAHAHERAKTATTQAERAFLSAVEITCESMRAFSERFAVQARVQAALEAEDGRRSELHQIAESCAQVPWNPPRTFREAAQAVWFTQNATLISYGAGCGLAVGRLDQLLLPYFEADLEKGTLTESHALRIVEELLIKLNNNVVIWPNIGGVQLNHLGSDVENITLGGTDRDGNDASHRLTELFLDAVRSTSLATTVSVRISERTPPHILEKALSLHRDTNSPAFLSDETAVSMLENDGVATEDARDYCLVGCVEPAGNGDTCGATGGTKVYFPTALDLVFRRGRTTFFGSQDGEDTGDPAEMKSFEELLAAFYRQLDAMVGWVTQATNLRDRIWADRFHNPLLSSTIDGCIENARDLTCGGAKYNFGSVGGGGLGTAVDSLSAIRSCAFEERSISIRALTNALRTNFRDAEGLRQRLLAAPKFGNDIEGVDLLARDVVSKFCEMVRRRRTAFGGHYKASLISYGLNVYEGALEPASPNGRRAGEPLSNSMSPSNGAERNGPTATLQSLARIDQSKIGFGNSLNMRLPIGILKTQKGLQSTAQLVRTYFRKGGYHVQFNTVDSATLRAAQEHPDEYPDLIVRVSGYSAYFTRLGRSIQDDIIERTEFAGCG